MSPESIALTIAVSYLVASILYNELYAVIYTLTVSLCIIITLFSMYAIEEYVGVTPLSETGYVVFIFVLLLSQYGLKELL